MATTFKFGNGNWAVKEDYALAYNDENGNFKPLPFDFTRASSATRVNKNGLIETVPSGKPRIDFLNNTSGHLLLEPLRRNLNTKSEDISGFSQKTNVTITNNETISPDGSVNASSVIATAVNAKHEFQNANISFTSGTSYTISVFIKANGYDYFAIKFASTGGVFGDDYAWFNASNGTIGTVDTDIDGTSIENYGNGWYRITATQQANATASGKIFLAIGNADNTPTFLGNGSSGLYVWGYQIEAGSYQTSYVKTEGSTVTRNADKCFQGGLTDKGILNNSAITIYLETDIQSDTSTNYQEIIGLYNDANSVNLRLETRTNNQLYIQHTNVVSSGDNFNNFSLGANSVNLKKIAISLTTTKIKIFADGSQIPYSGNGAYNLDFDRIGFRIYNNFVETLIKNKEIKLYNTALTDSELQALTSG